MSVKKKKTSKKFENVSKTNRTKCYLTNQRDLARDGKREKEKLGNKNLGKIKKDQNK